MLIGENLHIISKTTKEAIFKRDEDYVLNIIKKQVENGIKTIDLNIGPAKGDAKGALSWLIGLIDSNFSVNYSLDTTNIDEMREGFSCLKTPQECFLNSTSADSEKLNNTVEIVKEYNSNLIALTMSAETGIPKTPDERLELAMNIIDKTTQEEIDNSKVWLDPLILPVCAAQEQALVSLDTIRMFKESFDPEVKTLVGLSNVSNGCLKEYRPYLNRTFFALALGCGLDGAIIDGFDTKTIDVYDAIKSNNPTNKLQELYIALSEMMKNFEDLDTINFNKENDEEFAIYRCAQILLNKEIYTHSFI